MVRTGKLQCCAAWCSTVSNCCWHGRGLFWPRPALGTAEKLTLLEFSLFTIHSATWLQKRIKKKKKRRKRIQISKPRFVCETVRRRLKTQQPWSPWVENLKGAGREGLRTEGRRWTFGGSGFYSEELAQPCAKYACDLWKGSSLLPKKAHKMCSICAARRKHWEAVGKEAAKPFLGCVFLTILIFVVSISAAAVSPSLSSCFLLAVVSLVRVLLSHVEGEPQFLRLQWIEQWHEQSKLCDECHQMCNG